MHMKPIYGCNLTDGISYLYNLVGESYSSKETIMARIGLLEDNARIAKLCATFLQLAGHHVTLYEQSRYCLQALLPTSFNGNNAPVQRLPLPSPLPVDVLILDLSLPDISGFEVLWHLQSYSLTKQLPLILCTAAPSSELARALTIAPQARVVSKPFKLDSLVSAISGALNTVPQQAEYPVN